MCEKTAAESKYVQKVGKRLQTGWNILNEIHLRHDGRVKKGQLNQNMCKKLGKTASMLTNNGDNAHSCVKSALEAKIVAFKYLTSQCCI